MFLMTATIGILTEENRANAFTFSPCTIQSFKDLLSGATDKFPRVCLANRVCSHGVSTEGQDILPGVTYSLDVQCAMYFGEGFTYYVYGKDTNETLCYTMHCLNPARTLIYTLKRGATFGTPCGINKCCSKGECVAECSYPTSAPTTTCTATGLNTDVPQGCTDSGQLFSINGVYTTCDELVANYTYLCMTWEAARDSLCCETCHRAGVTNQTQHYETTGGSEDEGTSTVAATTTSHTTTTVPPTTTSQTTTTPPPTTTSQTTATAPPTTTSQTTTTPPPTTTSQTTTTDPPTTTSQTTTTAPPTTTSQTTTTVPPTTTSQTTTTVPPTTTSQTTTTAPPTTTSQTTTTTPPTTTSQTTTTTPPTTTSQTTTTVPPTTTSQTTTTTPPTTTSQTTMTAPPTTITSQTTTITPLTTTSQTTTTVPPTTTSQTTTTVPPTTTSQTTTTAPPTTITSQTTTTTPPTTTSQTTSTTKPPIPIRTTKTAPTTSTIASTSEPMTSSPRHVLCFTCGSYKNYMREDCDNADFNTTACSECWIYRQDLDDATVTYARGCQSNSSDVARDECDEFSSESCSTVGGQKLCRRCCKSDSCNDGMLTGMKDSASVTATNFVLITVLSVILATLM